MKEINNNKQMKDVWEFPVINKKEKEFGNHPTQKPKKVLERIILASTQEGDLLLDPFNGSGTTGIACKKLGRDFIGIELDKEYFEIAEKRIDETQIPML